VSEDAGGSSEETWSEQSTAAASAIKDSRAKERRKLLGLAAERSLAAHATWWGK
jgi:hypothetical protein